MLKITARTFLMGLYLFALAHIGLVMGAVFFDIAPYSTKAMVITLVLHEIIKFVFTDLVVAILYPFFRVMSFLFGLDLDED